jgi:DNA-binding HxlR family transcriptional regulator
MSAIMIAVSETTLSPQVTMTGRLDPSGGWSRERCPMAATLGVVSTRSAFLLLREAFYGAHRFEEFVQRTEVSEPVAAARLRELVDHGLLERVPYRDPGQRTRSGYRLTPKGAELLPALVALMDWGDRWALEGGAGVGLRHAGCGAPVHALLRCAAGHDVAADSLELAPIHPPKT